ncbi:ensconsin [Galendromus occidentalis]|uniref:Ensconsin n=1 Tax=Galendromus occidentalis TaxID=34638 RepID=A0AAJ7SHW1_9ACAR|nr:ensconsin [Galendromus occidentalis]
MADRPVFQQPQDTPQRSYWFAQSGSDVADCLRHQDSPVGYTASQNSNQIQAAQTPVGFSQPSGQQATLSDWGSSHSQDPHHAERVRQEARERQEELHRRRMEELAQHNEHAQRIREDTETDRRKLYQEKQVVHESNKQHVDDRRRALHEADQEWREAVLRRSQERNLRAEQYRKNRLSASILVEGNQPVSVMSSPARGASDELAADGHEDKDDKVPPLPSEKQTLMTASCFGSLWGSGALVQEDGDLMSRSMIVTSSAARRKTDLTPVTPSPWARGLGSKALPTTPTRPQTAAGSAGTPKRAVSMSRLDILAQPRRRFTMEDLKSRSHSAWKLNDSPQGAGFKGIQSARSMSHLSSTPLQPPRITRTSHLRQKARLTCLNLRFAMSGHHSASATRSEQVSPTHHLPTPHHLRSRSQMSSDLSQSSVASSVGSPHANMRPKPQGSANRKTRPLSIAGSIPSSELDKKDKPIVLRKPQKPVPPASSPEPQAGSRSRRSASPKKKEATSPQKEISRDGAPQNANVSNAMTESTNTLPVDIPLLMTQSFTEGCMPIENRPAESRKTKTREEAMAEIAEARKRAREEIEKQAEEERKKKEEQAAARRAIQEKRRQLEEEARLKREKEEEEKRRLEEEARKAEEERLRLEEEQKRLEEEKAKQEAIERQKKEEQERLERKKRVEEIMARTRKARAAAADLKESNGTQGGVENNTSADASPVRDVSSATVIPQQKHQNGLSNGHSANSFAAQTVSVGGGGGNVNVISEKKAEASEKRVDELISIENSNNGPSSTDSGTGSADFNSNSTQHSNAANNNVTTTTTTTTTTSTGQMQGTPNDASLVTQEAPLIQDLLS